MKFSNIKTVLGLTIGSAAAIIMAACSGSAALVETEAVTSPVTVAAGPLEAKEVLFAMDVTGQERAHAPIEAGTLVKGSSTLIYYVTDAGTLRPIPDDKTLAAFGFSPKEVIVVDDDELSTMPKGDSLTRLLFDGVGDLYWVANGQRWRVNEWKRIVHEFEYPDLATSHLDGSLQDKLPVHSLSGKLLRGQDNQVYYHMGRFITPVTGRNYDEAEVIEVPAHTLTAYTLQAHINIVWTRLNADTQAANIRSGPGVNFEVIDTIGKASLIIVKGRAEDSNWLQIKYWGRDAWLAGDLVQDQYLLSLLPTVNTAPPAPKDSTPQQTDFSSGTYTDIGAVMTLRNSFPVVVSLYDGAPADRAGVEVGDIIVEVDGVDVTTVSFDEAINRIRGEKGTEINLMVRRPSTNERLGIAIVRDEINSSVPIPTCHAQPIRGFGTVWQNHPEVRQWLGCPFTNFRRNEHATRAAVQTFEHGWMLWLETDTVANVDPIYVFFEDDNSYYRFGDRELVDAHSFAPTPQGFYKVGDRFAKVYWEELGDSGRQRLGYATSEARDSDGAFQEFEGGRMFWAGEADTIYIIYQGNFDFDGDGKFTWTQGWTSYEDTFEDPAEN